MNTELSPERFALEICKGIKKKSDKNKNLSTFLFLVVLIATVVTPLLILISDNFYVSKLSPAILSALAALSSYWIQLRKPHERWCLYRTAQRKIEFEMNKYKYSVDEYNTTDKDTILVRTVNELALKLHYDWMPMVPSTKDIHEIKKQN
jgi:hypothetical protein